MRSSILKVSKVLLITAVSCWQAEAFSQSYAYLNRDKVGAAAPQKERRQQLSSVLKSLEDKFNVRFNYNTKLVKDKSIMEPIIQSEAVLDDILSEILNPVQLSFEKVADNNYIILKGTGEQVALTVKGKVSDAKGEGLPGVSIRLKGANIGTTTDMNGNYSITLPDGNGVLIFTYIGFTSKEVQVNNQATINVTMADDSKTLEEVVVVGYGTQKKKDITGSVAIVNTSEMKKVSSNDVGQLLQGRTPGVTVTSDGQPGAFPQVKLRGISTFNNSDPLYVIDGVPISGVPRDFNPNDIESLQVLKDASAGAIYGSRAANGVIIITTKQGKKDTPMQVEYSGYYGLDDVWQIMPVTNAHNYQALNNEARLNASNKGLAPGNDPTSSRYITNINTDWQKEGLKTGSRQNHNLGFSGGGKYSTYNVSLDLFDNKGTFVGNGPTYRRYTGRINSTQEKGRFKFGQSFFYARSRENALVTADGVLAGGRPPLINDLVFAIPTMPLYDTNRKGGFGGTASDLQDAISLNGIGYNSLITNTTDVDRTFLSTYGEVNLLKNNGHSLKYRVNFGYDVVAARDYTFIPTFNLGYFFINNTARLYDNSRRYENKLIENTLNYQKTFGKHTIDVLVGQMYQKNDLVRRDATAQGFDFEDFPNLRNGAEKLSNSYEEYNGISSYLGRVNYNYGDKYLLTATARRDASSKFGEDYRIGYFPSIAVGWRITKEDFFNVPRSILSDLKLRASWGKLGNENLGNYQNQAVINPGIVYTFDGQRVLGGLQTNVVSETLKWEDRITSNIGLDAQLFNNKLDVSAEYYNSKSRDILVPIPIPLSVGSINSSPIVNAGTLRNSGLEFIATYHSSGKDFKYDISANVATLKNKVLALGNNVTSRIDGAFRTEVGGEVGRHYGFLTDGLFKSQEEINNHPKQFDGASIGDVRFKDISGPSGTPDGVINDYDRTDLGSGIPKFTYGLNFNASYKSFDFTIFASGAGDYLINSRLYRDLMHSGGDANYHEDMLNRYTSVNTNTNVPRLTWEDPNHNWESSDREGWLQNGTFLRINTISLGYALPKKILKGINRVRIYATAQNVYTFQKYKGYNPDYTYGVFTPGLDNGSFPKPRTIMFGVQVGF